MKVVICCLGVCLDEYPDGSAEVFGHEMGLHLGRFASGIAAGGLVVIVGQDAAVDMPFLFLP